MAVEDRFAWAEGARLFAGVQELLRPSLGNSDAFRPLPATPTADALAALGAAITQRAPFCLSDRPLPEDLTCPPGVFLTLTGG
ncbi:MAG TPA: hypothetical protein DC031_13555, partial [Sulfitobacter sp.]|nr:hypothetical protein [Sulfitobacter sp.]HBB84260.1 hypothetical protein [Sulfitobacter sp.]